MKPYSGLVAGAVASVVAISPAQSADIQVVDFDIRPESTGLQVKFAIAGDNPTVPQVFTVSRNNETIADIVNTNIDLGDRQKFTQQNPMPGIKSIEIMQLDPQSVRIVAVGENSAPTGTILSKDNKGFTFNFATTPQTNNARLGNRTTQLAQNTPTTATPTPAPATTNPVRPPEPEILFPDPQIPQEGRPTSANVNTNILRPTAPIPPFLPRASAPPVGDISVSTINTTLPNYIDLGTAAVVPRLVLREAPVQDVLTLLARSADLNVVFSNSQVSQPRGEGGDAAATSVSTVALADKTISLDLENEPVQDVFNYVLMLSDLKATVRGRTIFVGNELPSAIVPSITRTFRLNQVKVAQARCYLETGNSAYEPLSAEERQVEQVEATSGAQSLSSVGGSSGSSGTSTSAQVGDLSTTITGTSRSDRDCVGEIPENATNQGLFAMFADMEIRTDERLNSITLTGDPKVVDIASNLLTQLDARKRQVALNVKIMDVSLSGNRSIASDIKLLLEDRIGISAGDGIILSPQDIGKLSNSPFGDFSTENFIIEQGSEIVDLGKTLDVLDLPSTDTERTNSVFLEGNLVKASVTLLDEDGIARGTITRVLGERVNAIGEGTNFIGSLVANLLQNSTNKIIADPTLVIQEGEFAQIQVTDDIIVGVTSEVVPLNNDQRTVVTKPNIQQVGLSVGVNVDSVDDNGFVSLTVSPSLSSVGEVRQVTSVDPVTQTVLINDVALRKLNALTSGLVRLRDDQTLILAGLVRDESSVTTSKVPLLGDIPILGSLFRSSSSSNSRRELLFIITPQIIDDSQNATWGYGYQPSPTAQELLGNERFPSR